MIAAPISPTAFLGRLAARENRVLALFLLTGESGAGKTAWCLELLRLARGLGWRPAGLVSPAVFEAGVKTRIDLLDVATGERRRLASRRPGFAPREEPGASVLDSWQSSSDVGLSQRQTSDTSGLNWDFDPETVAWGNQVLERLPVSDLLLLDELGPLEFQYHAGLSAGLLRLDDRRDRTAVVVIRRALLPAAQARWQWAQTFTVADAEGGRGESREGGEETHQRAARSGCTMDVPPA